MINKGVQGNPWTRVFVNGPDELGEAERELGFEALSTGFMLRLTSVADEGIRVHEIKLIFSDDRIITIEPTGSIPILDELEVQLQLAKAATPFAVCLALVHSGYAAVARSLTMIESDIRNVQQLVKNLDVDTQRLGSVGVSDLPQVSEALTEVDQALSHASDSIGRLIQLARQLRRRAARDWTRAAINQWSLDEAILEGDMLARRLEFVVGRQRFYFHRASQQISVNDLFVVKVFTALWAILIPGGTLVNWYGQNLKFMPELSSPSTIWIQLVGVFILAALPILLVKQAGQLR